jgi:transcriptional regulator with XRE-family HTH domain
LKSVKLILMENIPTPEAMFSDRVFAFRKAMDWSQEELARRMSEFGFSWRQTTVAKVENAQRPLRLNEAAALAAVFDVDLSEMLRSLDDERGRATRDLMRLTQKLGNAHRRVRAAEAELESATEDLTEARNEREVASERFNRLQAAAGSLDQGSEN